MAKSHNFCQDCFNATATDKPTEILFVDIDTFILVVACTFMIIIGMIFKRAFGLDTLELQE